MVRKAGPPISLEQMQELISCIYDAALNEYQWGHVLNTLAIALNAEQGNLRMLNPESRTVTRVHTFNKDPYWTKFYIDYYINDDPWVDLLFQSDETHLSCTHHMLSDKEYGALEFYNDFVKPQDMHYGIGGKINIRNDLCCYMTFQRSRKQSGFELHYLEVLKSLVPHIQKALLINEKTRYIELKHNSLRDTLNQINSPLLLAEKNGKIVFINSLAEQLIEQHASINIKNNCISLASQTDNAKLQNLIHQATTNDIQALPNQGGAMYYIVPANDTVFSILVNPINPNNTHFDTPSADIAVLLLSTNKHQITLSAELLTALYNLTPAEARLTVQLCQGSTLDEVAKNLCLSKNTLRSQLRSIFSKTGVARQAELINLVNTGPAGMVKTA